MGIMSFDWCFFRIWFNEFYCEDMVNEIIKKQKFKNQENKMPLEGKQLQNVAKTVQQVVNEEQSIREIEEMIRKAEAMGAPDEVTEGLGKWIKSKTTDKVRDAVKREIDNTKKAFDDHKKWLNKPRDDQEPSKSDAQKKIDAGQKAPAGWKNVDGRAVKK